MSVDKQRNNRRGVLKEERRKKEGEERQHPITHNEGGQVLHTQLYNCPMSHHDLQLLGCCLGLVQCQTYSKRWLLTPAHLGSFLITHFQSW